MCDDRFRRFQPRSVEQQQLASTLPLLPGWVGKIQLGRENCWLERLCIRAKDMEDLHREIFQLQPEELRIPRFSTLSNQIISVRLAPWMSTFFVNERTPRAGKPGQRYLPHHRIGAFSPEMSGFRSLISLFFRGVWWVLPRSLWIDDTARRPPTGIWWQSQEEWGLLFRLQVPHIDSECAAQ